MNQKSSIFVITVAFSLLLPTKGFGLSIRFDSSEILHPSGYISVDFNELITPNGSTFRLHETGFQLRSYSAIPVHEMTEKDIMPIVPNLSIGFSYGVSIPLINRHSRLQIEFGTNYIRDRIRNPHYYLRFSDMIDPAQGFTHPSNLITKNLVSSTLLWTHRTRLLTSTDFTKKRICLGFGYNSTVVVRSVYTLEAIDGRSDKKLYYKHQNLTIRDRAFSIAPEVSILKEIQSFNEKNLFIELLVAFPAYYCVPQDQWGKRSIQSWLITVRGSMLKW